jgi:hypothetical protein
MRREEFLACAAQTLGPERFNRLVASAPGTREQGRFRFWQEQLLARLSAETGAPLPTVEEFLDAFEGAAYQPIPKPPLTKAEFFSDPNQYLYSGEYDIPDEWFAEAWERDPYFRENVGYEYVREVSKNGSLEVLPGLEHLARILPLSRMVELYRRIRDNSPHREIEFRPDFERIFGERMSAFPPMLRKREIIEALGQEAAEALGVLEDDAYPE